MQLTNTETKKYKYGCAAAFAAAPPLCVYLQFTVSRRLQQLPAVCSSLQQQLDPPTQNPARSQSSKESLNPITHPPPRYNSLKVSEVNSCLLPGGETVCSVFQVSPPTTGNSSGRRSTNGAWRLKPAAAAPCRHGRRFLNLSPRMRPLHRARHKQPVKAQARTNMAFSSVCCCERLMWVDGGVCLQESGSQREDVST